MRYHVVITSWMVGAALYLVASTSLYAGVVTTTLQVSATTLSTKSVLSMSSTDDELHVHMPEAMPYEVVGEEEGFSIVYSEDGFSIGGITEHTPLQVQTFTIVY